VLKQGRVRAHLIGNIEVPVLQFLSTAIPEDVFVYELSSFQLTNLKKSPSIAVLLNIYPEHLDYYGGSFKEYTKAKANITRHQTAEDFLIYNSENSEVCKIAKSSKAQKIPFGKNLRSSASQKEAELLYPWVASAEPAILIGKLFGIAQKKIEQAVKNFKPLPHRLQRVGEWKGITFYNDSLATIPEATIAALDALGPKVYTLIAGGYDRGISFEKLGKKIEKSSVRVLVLFPTTGKKILESMKYPPKHFFAKDMKEAVSLCYAHTPKGKICLLSPASSSFNMFKDYKDRGNQFKKLAKKYGSR
jgi:UDP-N-acetylmuramoylalanine--D-glutamate ligase